MCDLLSPSNLRLYCQVILIALSSAQVVCQANGLGSRAATIDQALLERIQTDEAFSVVIEDLKVQFAIGTLELIEPGWVKGFGAAGRAGRTHEELKMLYKERLWPLIINLVAKQNFGDDFHYYLLGYCAEQLGYLEAAAIYYEKSIVQSGRPMRGKCVLCMSIKFPDRSITSLERVRHRLKEN